MNKHTLILCLLVVLAIEQEKTALRAQVKLTRYTTTAEKVRDVSDVGYYEYELSPDLARHYREARMLREWQFEG